MKRDFFSGLFKVVSTIAVDFHGSDKNLVPLLEKISKSLKELGRVSKQTGGLMGRLTNSKLAEAMKELRAVEGMMGEDNELIGPEDKTLEKVLRDSEGALAHFQRSAGNILKGIGEGFSKTFSGDIPFATKQGEKAFKDFHTALDAGLTDVFFTRFTGNMDKVEKRWERFTGDLEKAFKKSLAQMASAFVQESITPALAA